MSGEAPARVDGQATSCAGCQRETRAAELNLSGAGQWLCRSCLARYEIEVASRLARATEDYRRCTCGAVVGPADEIEVPMYLEKANGSRALNAEYMFRRSVYRCGCGQEYRLRHPFLLVGVSLAMAIFLLTVSRAGDGQVRLVTAALVALFMIPFGGPDVYLRLRFPHVAPPR